MGKPARNRALKPAPRGGRLAALRALAEQEAAGRPVSATEPSRETLRRMVHELQVHEIELQMQNEELIRTQLELEESLHRFADLFNFAPVAYVVLDPDETVIEANPAAARLFGYDLPKLVGHRFWRLAPPGSCDALRAHQQEVRETRQRLACELEFTAEDGRVFLGHVESQAFPRPSGGPLQSRSAIIDVTARREAERVHRVSERALVEVSEHEKQRIGADLHDGLGQWLTATEFLGVALRERLAAEYPALEALCAQVCANLREAITQTRAMARGLAPVRLEQAGLMEALAELAHRLDGVAGIGCHFECPAPVLVAQNFVANHLYRIAQEAVNNALRHGRPRHVTVRLRVCEGRLQLRVSDDGQGFDPAIRKTGSLGLELMRHRARVLGGALAVDARPGHGVVVECTLPWPAR